MNLRHVLGLAALLFPLVTIQTILGVFPHPTPPEDPTPAEATSFFEANYGIEQAQTLFHIVGILWFGVFLFGLAALLRGAEPGAAAGSRIIVGLASAMVAVKVAMMILVSVVIASVGEMDGGLLFTLYTAGWLGQALIVYFFPFLFGAIWWTAHRSRAVAPWVAWSALAVALLSVPAIAMVTVRDMAFAAFPAFLLAMAWTAAAGVYFLATARTATSATPKPMPERPSAPRPARRASSSR